MERQKRRQWTADTIKPVVQAIMSADNRTDAAKEHKLSLSVALRWARKLGMYDDRRPGRHVNGNGKVETKALAVQRKGNLTCKRCGNNTLTVHDFPKSAISHSGRLGICRSCFGGSISGSRKLRNKANQAEYGRRVINDDPIEMANQALNQVHGGKRIQANREDFHKLVKAFVQRLAVFGIELEELKVSPSGKIKTIYRIEEEIEP